MSFGSDFIKDVDFGKAGGYEGIPMSDTLLDNVLAGIQPGRYDVIGGPTGSGKSAFVDDKYILSPINWLIENREETDFDYTVSLYSQEIPKKKKLSKWATYYMFNNYNVLADWKTVLSFGKNRTSSDLYDLSMIAAKYLDELERYVILYEGGINPTGIYKNTKRMMLNQGKIEHKKIVDKDGFERIERIYVPSNSKHIFSVITDTLGLLKKESDLITKKRIIDKHSSYVVDEYRNLYNMLAVDVSQLNRAIGNVERLKLSELQPQLEDFKETGEPAENADTVMAIFSPDRYNLDTYLGYNVKKMKSKPKTTGVAYRAVFILKNRNGDDMVSSSYRFVGGQGKFDHLEPIKEAKGYMAKTEITDEEYKILRLESQIYKILS